MDAAQHFLKGTVSSEELAAALSYAAGVRRTPNSGSAEPQTEAYRQMRTVHTIVFQRLHSYIRDDADSASMRPVAATAFELARAIPAHQDPIRKAVQQVHLGCYAILCDRREDFSSELADPVIPANLLVAEDWGVRVQAVSLAMWLHLLRNRDRSDLIEAKELCLDTCASIERYEQRYLDESEKRADPRPSAYLVVHHSHCSAAEILVDYLTGGLSDGGIDILKRVTPHFERAEYAANVATLFDGLCITVLLARTAQEIVAAAEPQKARVGRTEMQMPVGSVEAHVGKHHA